jgi:hypothetical protein
MKRLQVILQTLSVLIGTLLPSKGCGQGSFLFRNYYAPLGLDAPVFDAAGNRLAGTNYLAVLYGGRTPDSLQLATYDSGLVMSPVPFTYMPTGQGGYFFGRYVIVEDVDCGAPAWLQVRVWDVRLGASYEEVASQGLGGHGQSPLFQAVGGLPLPCVLLPTPPRDLIGLQSFSLVPEPSAGLLLLLGLPGLAIIPRRCTWHSGRAVRSTTNGNR